MVCVQIIKLSTSNMKMKPSKYRAKFVTKMWHYAVLNIYDESDPYKEARIYADKLKAEDFTFDEADVEIEKLRRR